MSVGAAQRFLGKLGRWCRRDSGPAIGFDLGAHRLHLAQMEFAGERPRIRAAVSLRCPEGRESVLESPSRLRALMATAHSRVGLRGRRVVTAMPVGDLKLMVLGYRVARHEDESAAILQLVRERVGGDLADYVVDRIPIRLSPDGVGEHSALVAVARRSAVVRYLEQLRGAGLEVVALEVSAAAAMRAVHWVHGGDTARNSLILHCGREGCELIVLWGRRLVLCRQVDFGEDALVEALRKRLDMPFESAARVLFEYGVHAGPAPTASRGEDHEREIRQTVAEILRPAFAALAAQVNDALVYTASRTRGATIDEVYLLGRFGRWPGVEELLHELLAIPVRSLDLSGEVPSPAESTAAAPARGSDLAVAVGLALRGMIDGS